MVRSKLLRDNRKDSSGKQLKRHFFVCSPKVFRDILEVGIDEYPGISEWFGTPTPDIFNFEDVFIPYRYFVGEDGFEAIKNSQWAFLRVIMRKRKIQIFSGFSIEETLIPPLELENACFCLRRYLESLWNSTKSNKFDYESWTSEFKEGPFHRRSSSGASFFILLYLVDLIVNGSTLAEGFNSSTPWPDYLTKMDTDKLAKDMSVIVGLSVMRKAFTLPGDTTEFIEKLESTYRDSYHDSGFDDNGDDDNGDDNYGTSFSFYDTHTHGNKGQSESGLGDTKGQSRSNSGDDAGTPGGTEGQSKSNPGDEAGTAESERGNKGQSESDTKGQSMSNSGDDAGKPGGTEGQTNPGDEAGTAESEHGSDFNAPLLKMEYEKLLTNPSTLGVAILNAAGNATSKKRTQNICWLISIFQALSHLPHFIRVLAESKQVKKAFGVHNLFNLVDKQTAMPKDGTLLLLLWHHACFGHCQDQGVVVNLREFHDCFYKTLAETAKVDDWFLRFTKKGWESHLKRNGFNDVEAGFTCLIRLLEKSGASDLMDVFSYCQKNCAYCELCRHVSEEIVVDASGGVNIVYSVAGRQDDNECFEKQFYECLFSSDNDLKPCDRCGEKAMRKSVCKTSDVAPKIMCLSFGKEEVACGNNKQTAAYPALYFARNFFCIPTSHSLQTFDIYQTVTAINGIGNHYVTDVYNDTGSQVCHYDDNNPPVVETIDPNAPFGEFERAFIFAKLLDQSEITNTHREYIGMSVVAICFPYITNPCCL